MTTISNRKKFEADLAKEIARSNRYKHPFSLVLFDVDCFKSINDSRGHEAGDEVLKAIASLVSSNIRKIDIFARWGGDEFVLILPGIAIEQANLVSEKLRQSISQMQTLPDTSVTCSFGVAEYRSGDSLTVLLAEADGALYNAKKSGRNRVENRLNGE